ncbi:MAG: adenosylcobinamide-GDP ribazoletransferase [Lachnospiraceae bacterium]|nr:adenosylcobinamide-GDP ribazoletransferase [Lachnospiraceae bacterium]
MSYIKGLLYALSLYTRIPVPAGKLKAEDGRKAIVFLPVAGAIIGLIIFGLSFLFSGKSLPELFVISVYTLVPLVLTGGFHVDGFMDVADAKNSYKSPEEKLKILKDPHIGAFAIIRLVMLGFVWLTAMSVLVRAEERTAFYLCSISFFMVRAACALLSVCVKRARKDGMLISETDGVSASDKLIISLQLVAGIVVMIALYPLAGVLSVIAVILFSVYYVLMCMREFSGVTGDTAGYYITVCETLILTAIAASELICHHCNF